LLALENNHNAINSPQKKPPITLKIRVVTSLTNQALA